MDTSDPDRTQRRIIMELNRWKLIAGGAALVGVAVGGAAASANSDDGFDLNDRKVIELTAERSTADTGFDIVPLDLSPESPDSPNESAEESPDSPFDSPDDEGFVDPSPESPDSPNESPEDSPAPAPAPAADDSPGSPDSPDSPNSADS
jgi:hypothetical protein